MALIYLASPYSHDDPEVRQQRFEQVCKTANDLMQQGYQVFCPIAHSHPIEQAGGKIESHEFWMKQDIAILKHCTELVICTINGWQDSRGVKHERELAEDLLLPISYIMPSWLKGAVPVLHDVPTPVMVGNSYKYA